MNCGYTKKKYIIEYSLENRQYTIFNEKLIISLFCGQTEAKKQKKKDALRVCKDEKASTKVEAKLAAGRAQSLIFREGKTFVSNGLSRET